MLFIDIILIPTKSASASRLGGAQRSDVARNLFEIELTKFHERSRHIQQGHDLDIVHENFKPTTRSVSLYNHLRPRAFENERAERLSLSKKDASLFGRLGFRLLGRGFLLRRRLLLRRRFLLGYERSSKHTHGHRIIVSLYNSFARASSIPRAFFYFPPIPLMFPAPDRETYPRVSSSPPASSSPRASSSPPVSSWLRFARNERDVSLSFDAIFARARDTIQFIAMQFFPLILTIAHSRHHSRRSRDGWGDARAHTLRANRITHRPVSSSPRVSSSPPASSSSPSSSSPRSRASPRASWRISWRLVSSSSRVFSPPVSSPPW